MSKPLEKTFSIQEALDTRLDPKQHQEQSPKLLKQNTSDLQCFRELKFQTDFKAPVPARPFLSPQCSDHAFGLHARPQARTETLTTHLCHHHPPTLFSDMDISR